MKKIIPLFIIGILIFSGFGINIGKSNELNKSEKLQPDVKIVDIIGGFFRVEANVENVGDERAIIDSVTIYVDAPIMLLGRKTELTDPIGLDAGKGFTIATDVVFGLGPCTIIYTLNTLDQGPVTASAKGFIFGFFVYITQVYPSP
jgi:hypothetical protein